MPATASWVLGFGCMFTLFSLAFVAISFATDNWLVVTVDRSKLTGQAEYTSSPYYFTRNRGLFRTCYEGNETKFLDSRNDVIDGSCLAEMGYEINRNPTTINYGSDYDVRIHLMRSHFGFFVLSMLFLIVGALVGIIGCWRLKVLILQIGGLLVFIGAFFAAGGMAFFHGYDYLEREKINQPGDFQKYINANTNYALLKANSYWSYGYSYMLGWVGVGCAAIGAILFLVASFSVSSEIAKESKAKRKEEKKYKPNPYDANAYGGAYPYGYGNAGYMEDPYSAYNGTTGNAGYTPSYYPTMTPQYPAITY